MTMFKVVKFFFSSSFLILMQHAAHGDKYSSFCMNWHLFVFDILSSIDCKK